MIVVIDGKEIRCKDSAMVIVDNVHVTVTEDGVTVDHVDDADATDVIDTASYGFSELLEGDV